MPRAKWCARCGRTDTELIQVMSTSRREALLMCRDDRLCYPLKDIKITSSAKAGIQKL